MIDDINNIGNDTHEVLDCSNANDVQNNTACLLPASILSLDEDKPRKRKKHKGKKHKKKHSKKSKKSTTYDITAISQQMMDIGYRCSAAEAENRLLKTVLALSIGAKRGTFDDRLAETGLKLLSGGTR